MIKSLIAIALVFSLPVLAAKVDRTPTFKASHKNLAIPTLVGFSEAEFSKINENWKNASRKIASEMDFSEKDLTPDFVAFRDKWLATKNADDVANLLEHSYVNYEKYSPDVQYYLAQIHTARQMRGIIWRMRPLFDKGSAFFSGNRTTHISAIQFVRNVSTGLSAAFPTTQTDSLLDYFTKPSIAMSEKDQFKNIYQFQNFLTEVYVPAANESIGRMKSILSANPTAVWKWDNKMFFGRAAFKDNVNRVIGSGAAEMHMAIAATYEAVHDALVFSAYNQDAIINVIGELGKAFGIDAFSSGGSTDLGLTDQERNSIISRRVKKDRFLEIRNYENSNYGSELMKIAYQAKLNAINNMDQAHQKLQGKKATTAMLLNPALYQPDIQNRLNTGIKNMKSAIAQKTEIRDPISGDTVVLDIPAFYSNPPKSLSILMAKDFEKGPFEYDIKNNKGQFLKVRNYFSGRSIGWDNSAWVTYVPSASGQSANYMMNARRVMTFALGTNLVFGAVDIFVH